MFYLSLELDKSNKYKIIYNSFLFRRIYVGKNYEIKGGVLHIGGVSAIDLVDKYKTPLYVYDQKLIKDTARCFLDNFKSNNFKTEITYASKAFSSLYLLGLLNKLGLYVDTVSMGEIYTALQAGYDGSKIHFHGNNKTYEELEYAIDNNIGLIIIDNVDEFLLLEEILSKKDKKINALLRINPDVKTSTHRYIQTSNADSKFGINIRQENIDKIIKKIIESPFINLEGFHAHIGSQVLDVEFFKQEADILLAFTKKIENQLDYKFTSINFGGGFGVKQNHTDKDLDLAKFLSDFVSYVDIKIKELSLSIKTVGIEPGRSMINQAGTTLYKLGSSKKTLEGLPFIFIDGGMSDNIRPSLYEAKYDAFIANRQESSDKKAYRVGGKLCESGDILINRVMLDNPKRADILAVPSTGAYSFAMSSNYNKQGKPAVVFVEDCKDYVAVRAESLEDLIRNDERFKEE